MPTFRIAELQNAAAWIEVDGTFNVDESITVDVARWFNATAKTMVFTFKRASGAAILTRTVSPGTPETQVNVPGSATNRTLTAWDTQLF